MTPVKDKKTNYFNPSIFVEQVIADMNLGEVPLPTLEALREEISITLADRLVGTVIEALGEREMMLLENVLESHPEIDEMDALMILGPQIPGIKERLERALGSLHFELTRTARDFDRAMNDKKQK